MAIKKVKELQELNHREIGKRIRNQREAMHLTRDELASELNVTAKFIADIEYGDKGMSMQTLYKLMQHLNLSADFILERDSLLVAEEDAEIRQLKENILVSLSVCNAQQLKCMEQIVRYYTEAISVTMEKKEGEQ